MDLATNSDCEKMNKSGAPIAPAQAEGTVAKPKRKRPRLYFARLDPRKDLKKQMASRMVQFLCAESDEDGRQLHLADSFRATACRRWLPDPVAIRPFGCGAVDLTAA
jgi:hypothetical protein